MKSNLFFITACCVLLASCGNNKPSANNGPIVLGDTATIVTEKDSQYLKDDIMDLGPSQAATAKPEAVATPVKPAAEAPKPETPPAKDPVKESVVSGHTIAFGTVKIVFEGIVANDASRQNPAKQDGLSYVVKSGDLETSKIHIYGSKDATIKDRYQTRLTLHSKLGTVDLRDLGLYMSGWKTIPASKSGDQILFPLSDLNKVIFSAVNNSKIKNATDRELRDKRTNRKVIQNWMKEISRVKSANDEPCEIILDNVQLQISGTGTDGKTFRKNIRVSA